MEIICIEVILNITLHILFYGVHYYFICYANLISSFASLEIGLFFRIGKLK